MHTKRNLSTVFRYLFIFRVGEKHLYINLYISYKSLYVCYLWRSNVNEKTGKEKKHDVNEIFLCGSVQYHISGNVVVIAL